MDAPTIIAWVHRVFPRLGTLDPFELLELEPTDDAHAITAAFEHLFESRHPDLYRETLGRTEQAMLEQVFAAVVAAHRELLDLRPRRLARGTDPAPTKPTTRR